MKIIVTTNFDSKLANYLSASTNIPLILIDYYRFTCGELSISSDYNFSKNEIFFVYSDYRKLDILLFLLNFISKLGARNITLIMPYLPYSRQDKDIDPAGKIFVNILHLVGVRNLICIDIHSQAFINLCNFQVCNIETTSLFSPLLEKNKIIISPDQGGALRAQNLSNISGCKYICLTKKRSKKGSISFSLEENQFDLKDKDCVILDDLIDTGNTILGCVNFLVGHKVKSIEIFASHALLNKRTIEKFTAVPINKITITNTVKNINLIPKLILNQTNEFKSEAAEFRERVGHARDSQKSFVSLKMRNGINNKFSVLSINDLISKTIKNYYL